ncbi:monofunctional biosynthetic peptidoglycan transglycosylase [Stenotrophomonas koreensis]|uniref:monofunctional biosynthetic peptidoglycan transglycosylase n=1 Tax=Stenotrophomonas koreensis TaxID=266128 RepID=UPI0033927CEF
MGTGQPAGKRRRGWRWLLIVPFVLVLFSVLQVLVLRFVDPPFSMVMAADQAGRWIHGPDRSLVAYDWVDHGQMAACLPISLVAAEDQQFPFHRGFDLDAIAKARRHNERGGKVRGASTISQQVAKNLFLWQGRSWLRKGLEAWYTALIELFWPKQRIIEMYANIAEFGPGVYGAQAASHRFFGRDAARLSAGQCARLAAVLPSPRRYNAATPGPYVQRRAAWIQRQVRQLGGPGYLQEQ